MIISTSSLQMASRHEETKVQTREERLRFWIGDEPPAQPNATATPTQPADPVRISEQAKKAQAAAAAPMPLDDLTGVEDFRMQILKLLMEKIFGHDFEMFKPLDLTGNAQDAQPAAATTATPASAPANTAAQPPKAGWGLEYDLKESYRETETLKVAAQGVVKTKDGREIQISLSLSMSREYIEEHNLSLRLGDARLKDPLVINFGGNAAQLTQDTFVFDLDADGGADTIHFVAPGSGFLALDRDNNARIDDGNELFGPKTGNGMDELAQYDDDGNGWIDENDPVYQRLKLWTRNADGTTTLTPVKAAGIGAISLSAVSSPFEMRQADQSMAGKVRSTGLYLAENGGVGSMQQIDLAV